jgi:hypothetical protein
MKDMPMTVSPINAPSLKLAASVIRVGDGRGFIVNGMDGTKLVITAGHCLPELPPCMNFSDLSERTYRNLIGPIGQDPAVTAECLFVDPISDLAILGPPENQDLSEEYDAYEAFVEPLAELAAVDILPAPLPVAGGQPEGEAGWVLSLVGKWEPCRMWHFGGPLWLTGAEIEGGMSGSPILSPGGDAIGVIASNHAQPRLLHNLPVWMAAPAAGRQQPVAKASTRSYPYNLIGPNGEKPEVIPEGWLWSEKKRTLYRKPNPMFGDPESMARTTYNMMHEEAPPSGDHDRR